MVVFGEIIHPHPLVVLTKPPGKSSPTCIVYTAGLHCSRNVDSPCQPVGLLTDRPQKPYLHRRPERTIQKIIPYLHRRPDKAIEKVPRAQEQIVDHTFPHIFGDALCEMFQQLLPSLF